MGRRRKGRNVHGVILLDKPIAMSSNAVLQKVKRLFFAAKAGHTGALDPLATGMLPICLGEATKFSQYLLDSDKRYLVTAKLGIRTSTSDSDGEIVSERPVDVDLERLQAMLTTFLGDIEQTPSMYSALKYQGQPLYKYARQGIDVPRKTRNITVFSIQLIRFEKDEVDLEIHCSKGTYIRTIVDDLGELLGCGAHVTALRRTQVANYPYENMVSLNELIELSEKSCEDTQLYDALDNLLLPVDTAIQSFPEVHITEIMAEGFQQGQSVQVASAPLNTTVRVFSGTAKVFLGLAEVDEFGNVAPKRLVRMESTLS